MITLQHTGDEANIHPKNKKGVGTALSNAVKNIMYGVDVEFSGPIIDRYIVTNQFIEISFTHSNNLHIVGDELLDLYFIENDMEIRAFGKIVDNKLRVIYNAKYKVLAMGYKNNPIHNLYNGASYLASPFRIDINI